ncbi:MULTISPECIES: elongation factor P maturation arginine rhamnosyltransferase EarP [unclassified Polaromonas]|uniref:elongation factor P maturation arginine rhamnosyltransferase EarP n=1 Tax=unclassified Polaromonas TaxID=2638319 RepID=UPI0018C9E7C2|nr:MULTISPECIES: elongation factor P maturation arginine rhamnosyltransferase EarP [unclassified Polaromonas]MBG6072675.1 putative repeat protein (TIGR03837 family) [Polaromonas sp. CG_9.7]MBG6114606.1 putative repeat protein (TIGR03837 family) [Polaromonas sp. CG_9.2]MDH6185233.1 putative repeat protein (TIGR03837 family) [Polaromonas sp. CG_23.6]
MNHRLQWDIFCKVIDNYGDIGVCWRLAADLATRGHRVRLWVDDACALQWMAPGGCDNVRVIAWTPPLALQAADFALQPCDVLVEAFGCDAAPEFIAACADQQSANGLKPVWINLEYLSAEAYVERCHALPSRVQRGPAAGWEKWFFYPGFTAATGGLLREPGLADRQSRFDAPAWLAAQGITFSREKRVSLFCYEPGALPGLLKQLAQHGLDGEAVRLFVAAGRASHAVKAVFNDEKCLLRNTSGRSQLSISYLPLLTQNGFDQLLWACDLNFVRGEDSLVRALWAGKPLVWQIYPQDDAAHLDKLAAFLDMLEAPASLRHFHQAWNRAGTGHEAPLVLQRDLQDWQTCLGNARERLMRQNDLCTSLLSFVAKNR